MPRFSSSKLTDNAKNLIRSSEHKGTINSKQEVTLRSKHENMSAGMEGRALGARSSSTTDTRKNFALKLDLSNDNLLNGIILAELLGKPKSLKRGRW